MKGILIEYVAAVRRAFGILLIAAAIALGSLHIFELAARTTRAVVTWQER